MLLFIIMLRAVPLLLPRRHSLIHGRDRCRTLFKLRPTLAFRRLRWTRWRRSMRTRLPNTLGSFVSRWVCLGWRSRSVSFRSLNSKMRRMRQVCRKSGRGRGRQATIGLRDIWNSVAVETTRRSRTRLIATEPRATMYGSPVRSSRISVPRTRRTTT